MTRRGIAALACACLVALAASPARALRIVSYNLTNYPGPASNVSTRNAVRLPLYRTILGPLNPDIVVGQEVLSQAGVDTFTVSVLNELEPGLADRSFEPGRHSLRWNGRHDNGGRVGAGIYFVRLSGERIPTQTARVAVIE